MAIIIGANSAEVVPSYSVENSCRFAVGDSAYMHKTPTSTGSRRIFTFSSWVKRGKIVADEYAIFTGGVDANAAGFFTIMFDGNNKIDIQFYDAGWDQVTTNRVFRDPAAWYHIVVAVDTTQSTDTNRIKLYVNGVQETSLSSAEYPDQNFDLDVNNTDDIMTVGVRRNSSAGLAGYFDGYLAETVLIDGTQYAASDFGEFDEDSPTIWKPKDVSELTFGTNGFYLDYEDSANLGNDANGGTDLTEVNLDATDQASDSPTNNFCVMNPLDNYLQATTFVQGNCHLTSTANYTWNTGTIGLTSGKWYFEMSPSVLTASAAIGVSSGVTASATLELVSSDGADGTGWQSSTGKVYKIEPGSSTLIYTGNTYAVDDICGMAMDLDNLKFYFAKNNTWENSGDPTSGATGTGAISMETAASTAGGAYFPAWGWGGAPSSGRLNFGGCSAFTVSSAANDGNGYGNFEYAPPSGYLAICTKNLGSDGG